MKLLVFSSVIAAAWAQGSGTPTLNFDCATIPAVCNNMCWGAFCTVPSFGTLLTYDNYAGQGGGGEVDMTRRTASGCQPNPNRCADRDGENCDEFPFASTLDADEGGTISRCVPETENSSQGGTISQFIQRNCPGNTCEFLITFGNPGGVRYCDASTSTTDRCVNDMDPPIFKRMPNGALEEDNDLSASQRSQEQSPAWALFLLASGTESLMPASIQLNHTVFNPRARNASLLAEAQRGDASWDSIEWDFDEDTVIARLD